MKQTDKGRAMPKTLQWFRTGEAIPMDACYIKAETRQINNEWSSGGSVCVTTFVDFHLYEVRIEAEE